jgi:hypothetical protein
MPSVKVLASIVAAVALAALASFFYGRSGAAVDQDLLAGVQLRLQLVEARAQVLDGRVSLYLVNFGDASRHFAFAKGPLAPARVALEARRRSELVAKLDQASKELDAAQDLATRLSQDANSRAGEAARLLNDVIQGVGSR